MLPKLLLISSILVVLISSKSFEYDGSSKECQLAFTAEKTWNILNPWPAHCKIYRVRNTCDRYEFENKATRGNIISCKVGGPCNRMLVQPKCLEYYQQKDGNVQSYNSKDMNGSDKSRLARSLMASAFTSGAAFAMMF